MAAKEYANKPYELTEKFKEVTSYRYQRKLGVILNQEIIYLVEGDFRYENW